MPYHTSTHVDLMTKIVDHRSPLRRALRENLASFLILITLIALSVSIVFPSALVNAQAVALGPTILEAFDGFTDPAVDVIHVGQTAVQSFLLTNPNTTGAITNVNFQNQLPPNVVYLPATLTSTCGANPTISNGNTLLSLPTTANVTLGVPPNNTCLITIEVTPLVPSFYSDTTNPINAGNAPPGNQSTANLNVLPALTEPNITKTFSPSSVGPNGTSTLTITIANPNPSVLPTGINDLKNVAFTDNLAALGLTSGVGTLTSSPADPLNCGGAFSTAGGIITWTGGTIVAGESCVITVPVTAPGTNGAIVNTIAPNTVTYSGGSNTTSVSGTLVVVSPPTLTKAFGGDFAAGGTTTMSFTITNPNPAGSGPLTNLAFNDVPLPGGLVIDNPRGLVTSGSCATFTVNAASGGASFALTNGSLNPGQFCTIRVNVTSPVAGANLINTTTPITGQSQGQPVTGNAASATVNVTAPDMIPPSINKSFPNATSITLGDNTQLRIVITNPNSPTTGLRGVAFDDLLPAGLIITNPSGLVNGCGGTVTAPAGGTSITLRNGVIPAASASCTITLNITGVQVGSGANWTNTIPQVRSVNGGNNNTPTSATLNVTNTGTGSTPLDITKNFTPASMTAGSVTTISFDVHNPDAFAQFGATFTDTLPSTPGRLVVANTPNIRITGPVGCAGTITAVRDTQTISLANGFIPAGATCTFSVDATTPTASATPYLNTTSPISSTNVGAGSPSNTAQLDVTGTSILPATIQKAFAASAIAQNGTTTLTFTVTNPNGAGVSLNNFTFTDNLPNNIQVAAPPNFAGTCPGAATGAISSPSAGVVSVRVASLPPGTCTLTVDVTGHVPANPGTANNLTGPSNSDNGGDGPRSNTASITVEAPPTVQKTFIGGPLTPGGTATLRLTITNPNNNPQALTNVTVVDNLPVLAGGPLTQMTATAVGAIPAACGAGATWAISNGGTTLTFQSPSMAIGAVCVLDATVLAPAAGTYQNRTQPSTSTNGGTGAASNNATLTVNSISAGLQVQKFFSPTTLLVNQVSQMRIVIRNPTAQAQTGVAFADIFPSGLNYATGPGEPNEQGNCNGGTVTMDTVNNTLNLSNGSLPANSTCTLTVDVTSPTPNANYSNTVSTTSLQVTTPTTASAGLTFIGPPAVSKTFNLPAVVAGQPSTLSLVITNPNQQTALQNLTVTDTLPAGLTVTGLTASAGCGGGTVAQAGDPVVITLTNGTIAAGAGNQCIITGTASAASAGVYTNQIPPGAVTTSNAGNNTQPASATLTAVNANAVSLAKAFNPPSITPGATSTMTFTIFNSAGNPAQSGLGFTENLPAGLTIAAAPASPQCGGTVTATVGGNTVVFANGTLAAATPSCNIDVTVTGMTPNAYVNDSSHATNLSPNLTNNVNATLTITAPAAPTLLKSFTPGTVVVGIPATMTFTIVNSVNNPAVNSLGFTETLPAVPAGLTIAAAPVSPQCGGTVTATPGGNTVTLANGSLGVGTPSCTVSVLVISNTANTYINNQAQVTNLTGGLINNVNATLTVTNANGLFSLGNRVWFDTNNNGQIDTGEAGLAGIVMNLLDAAGNPTGQTTTTDANGYYLFANLAPGTYIVQVAPSNFAPGGPLAGLSSSTPVTNSTTNSNPAGVDNMNNGIADASPAVNGIRSAPVTLTLGNIPLIESDLGPLGTGGSADANSNLTVDFGFFGVRVTPTPTVAPSGAGSPLPGSADPVFVKLVDPALALPGELVTYTTTVTNNGTAPTQNTVVTDPVPSTLQIQSASTTLGTLTINGNTVTFNVGSVNPGQVVTLIVHARIRPDVQPPADIVNVAHMGDKTSSASLRVTRGVLPSTGDHPDAQSSSTSVLAIALTLLISIALAAVIVGLRRHIIHPSG